MNPLVLLLFHIPQLMLLLCLAIHRWASPRIKKHWFLLMAALCAALVAALVVYDVDYLSQTHHWLMDEINLAFYISLTEVKYLLLVAAAWKSFQIFKSN